jgi:ribonuclease HI
MADYEALLLGLKLLKALGAAKVSILGDSDLIIQQMKGNFVTNDNRMRAYRTAATNILKAFIESKLAKISRNQNIHARSLATFASTCKLPFEPNHYFTVEIKHRAAIPNNVKD